jgi:DTW domain-containing protein YfiP
MLQHVLEVAKVSNTGRIAALALPSLERRVYGALAPALLADLPRPGTFLLFPSEDPLPALESVERVVVLDASWKQARKMVQRVPELRALPRLSLPIAAPAPSLRTAPAGGVSTLQAIARCVGLLEGSEPEAALEALHALLMARVMATRGYV